MSAEPKPAKPKQAPRRRAPNVEYRFHDPTASDGTDTAFVRLKKAGWVASTSNVSDKPRVVLLKRTKK